MNTLKEMLDALKEYNISININGYKTISKKGNKNRDIYVSGNTESIKIGFYSEAKSYSKIYEPKPKKNYRDREIESIVGEALFKIHTEISASI